MSTQYKEQCSLQILGVSCTVRVGIAPPCIILHTASCSGNVCTTCICIFPFRTFLPNPFSCHSFFTQIHAPNVQHQRIHYSFLNTSITSVTPSLPFSRHATLTLPFPVTPSTLHLKPHRDPSSSSIANHPPHNHQPPTPTSLTHTSTIHHPHQPHAPPSKCISSSPSCSSFPPSPPRSPPLPLQPTHPPSDSNPTSSPPPTPPSKTSTSNPTASLQPLITPPCAPKPPKTRVSSVPEWHSSRTRGWTGGSALSWWGVWFRDWCVPHTLTLSFPFYLPSLFPLHLAVQSE